MEGQNSIGSYNVLMADYFNGSMGWIAGALERWSEILAIFCGAWMSSI
jgi:hypothetical protein